LIAEKEVDFVFNTGVIAELAKDIKAPPDAITRFGDNIRSAVRAYFAERARTNWKAIGKQIGDLDRLVNRADHAESLMGEAEKIRQRAMESGQSSAGVAAIKEKGVLSGERSDAAAARLAACIGSVDQATRNWLERCARRPLSFPPSDEIKDRRTRKRAISRLQSILSCGRKFVKGRRRPGGKQSRTTSQSVLRVPKSSQGRPIDLAARELVQHLALAYAEATGRRPPLRVNLRSQGPFFRLVSRCFKEARITAGSVVELINEREIQRKKLERLHHWRSKRYGISKK
jgi:hypothetical protein